MAGFKIREDGKTHTVGDPNCKACDQNIARGIKHFPYFDNTGSPPCGGFVHGEIIADGADSSSGLYRCDKCGESR